MPEARYAGNGARHIDGAIYVPGGWDASNRRTNTLFAYSIVSNVWFRLAPLPAASACGGSAVLGGRLYVFSGCTPSATTGVSTGMLYRYDPSTDMWATLAPPPVTHTYPALGQIAGKIYVAGGHDGAGQPTTTLHVYDPATNSWSAKASMPGYRIFTSGYALGEKLYVVGGRAPPFGQVSATMLIYDSATDVWTSGQPMRTARDLLSLFGIGGRLYAVGGRSDFIAGHRTVERYTP
jgi:N-acetylneuraminic acid mutarotase